MNLWSINFETRRPLPHFPRLQVIASERRQDPTYSHEGRFRQAEAQCVFQYTLKGEGVFRDRRGEHRLPSGVGFLCKISAPETAYFYPAGGKETWEFVFVSMLGEATDMMVADLVARHGAVYRLALDHPLVRQWMALGRRRDERREIGAAESARGVWALMEALVASAEGSGENAAAGVVVRAAMEIIRQETHKPLNATELARRLRVSREHLSRIFREQTGQGLHRHMVRQKVLQACELLKSSSLSQKEIARELAFGCPAHFARTFGRVMHMSPSRFRAVGSLPLG